MFLKSLNLWQTKKIKTCTELSNKIWLEFAEIKEKHSDKIQVFDELKNLLRKINNFYKGMKPFDDDVQIVSISYYSASLKRFCTRLTCLKTDAKSDEEPHGSNGASYNKSCAKIAPSWCAHIFALNAK